MKMAKMKTYIFITGRDCPIQSQMHYTVENGKKHPDF